MNIKRKRFTADSLDPRRGAAAHRGPESPRLRFSSTELFVFVFDGDENETPVIVSAARGVSRRATRPCSCSRSRSFSRPYASRRANGRNSPEGVSSGPNRFACICKRDPFPETGSASNGARSSASDFPSASSTPRVSRSLRYFSASPKSRAGRDDAGGFRRGGGGFCSRATPFAF